MLIVYQNVTLVMVLWTGLKDTALLFTLLVCDDTWHWLNNLLVVYAFLSLSSVIVIQLIDWSSWSNARHKTSQNFSALTFWMISWCSLATGSWWDHGATCDNPTSLPVLWFSYASAPSAFTLFSPPLLLSLILLGVLLYPGMANYQPMSERHHQYYWELFTASS